MSAEHHDDELVPEQTEGFKVGEKKTIDEYQQLGMCLYCDFSIYHLHSLPSFHARKHNPTFGHLSIRIWKGLDHWKRPYLLPRTRTTLERCFLSKVADSVWSINTSRLLPSLTLLKAILHCPFYVFVATAVLSYSSTLSNR